MLRNLRSRLTGTLLVPITALTLVLTACGGDDGATVRPIDAGGETTATDSATDPEGHAAEEHEDEHEHAAEEHAECETEGTVTGEGEHVDVTLTEWMIGFEPERVPAGIVDLHVENTGAEEHELLIVEGAIVDLPSDERGALAEDELPEGAVIGEVEGVPAGKACDATFDLEPGIYTFLCNVVHEHDGEIEAHLAEGMAAVVTIE